LPATLDFQLPIHGSKVRLHGLYRDVEFLGNLSVGAAGGGKPGDTPLAHGETVESSPVGRSRSCTGGGELFAGAGGERACAERKGGI
jgi:hypothetical protein